MIVVESLAKRFGALTAVHDLSFTVGDGEIFGILGPNGAGKTTTVRMLAGLIEPSGGRAALNGLDLATDTEAVRAQTGILTELPGLHERLTARQNLAYYARLYGLRGRAQRDAVTRHLGLVGMGEHADRRVGGFSKGMRQKIAIARALLHDPQVIYLDEPTSGLDPSAATDVRDFVAALRDAGRSIVICTHNLDEAERLCDRIGIMRGTLLSVDTPAALRRRGRARPPGSSSSGRAGRSRSSDDGGAAAVRGRRAERGPDAGDRGRGRAQRQPGDGARARGGRRADRVGARGGRQPGGGLPPPGRPRRDRRRGGRLMRGGYVAAVFAKEWREIVSNRLLLFAVMLPAFVFAAIPTGLVAFIQARDLDPAQLGQISQYLAAFPTLPPKVAAQGFIVTNFMAYFLLIPADGADGDRHAIGHR